MKDYIEREAAIELLTMALDDDWEPKYAASPTAGLTREVLSNAEAKKKNKGYI